MSQGGISLLAMTAENADDPQTLRMVAGAIANLCGNGTFVDFVLFTPVSVPVQCMYVKHSITCYVMLCYVRQIAVDAKSRRRNQGVVGNGEM